MSCVKCGVENADTSKSCRKCGTPTRHTDKPARATAEPQSSPAATQEANAFFQAVAALKPNIAGLLCYVMGWISGEAFLLSKKDNKFVCFHAWQSIITFAVLSVVIAILNSLTIYGSIFFVLMVVLYWIIIAFTGALWIFLMFKAYQRQSYKLPLIGEITQRLCR
jgi:uncharacterized membrane protein